MALIDSGSIRDRRRTRNIAFFARLRVTLLLWLSGWVLTLAPTPCLPATYHVGPGQAHTNLQSVAGRLMPGDVVEIEGNTTYRGDVRLDASGTEGNPITIRGLRVKGRRPVISGVSEVEAAVIRVTGDHYIIEALEVTGNGDPKATRGLRNVGHSVVLRDVAVYDCAFHGILNSDAAGSLLLSHVEVYACGKGEFNHQVYVGMDNVKYPGATLRMEFCHIHDGNGGNNLKSRAGRNEIYYNWFEGAHFAELDLIGADRHGKPMDKANEIRADSDVVGNVIYKSSAVQVHAMRLGGDGSGASHGRYRFVNNTILLNPSLLNAIAVFKLQDDLESLEMHNNVFYRFGKSMRLLYDPGLRYSSEGSHNWIPRGTAFVPKNWAETRIGTNPGYKDLIGFDLRPGPASPLLDAGGNPAKSIEGHEFPHPLLVPKYQPKRIMPNTLRPAWERIVSGRIDIGAFEAGGD